MALRNLQSVIYTDKYNRTYRTRMDAAVFAQTTGDPAVPIVGGADLTPADNIPEMPAQLRPRHVVVSNGTNKRKVVCLTPDAPLFLGTVTTVNLQVLGGAAVAYARVDGKEEVWPSVSDPNS